MSSPYPMLAIDTSGAHACVAIALDSVSESAVSSNEGLAHSEELLELVQSLLREHGVELASVRSVVLGSGPGSFTGLRIGFSFVKGISSASGIPVLSFSSLRAACAGTDGRRAIAVDARRGEYFCGLYEGDDIVFEDLLMTPEELMERISGHTGGDKPVKLFCGATDDNFDDSIITGSIPNIAQGLLKLAKQDLTESDVISSSWKSILQEWGLLSLAEISPNYVRAVAAKTIAERALKVKPDA